MVVTILWWGVGLRDATEWGLVSERTVALIVATDVAVLPVAVWSARGADLARWLPWAAHAVLWLAVALVAAVAGDDDQEGACTQRRPRRRRAAPQSVDGRLHRRA